MASYQRFLNKTWRDIMRSLLLLASVICLSSTMAYADYTIRNVYKFENADMVATQNGSNAMIASVIGYSEDSNGNKASLK